MKLVRKDKVINILEDILNTDKGLTFYDEYAAKATKAIEAIKDLGEEPARSVLAWESVSTGYRCPCGYVADAYYSYCPNCGSIMHLKAFWRFNKAPTGPYVGTYSCSRCDRWGYSPTPYCCNCGSEMTEVK